MAAKNKCLTKIAKKNLQTHLAVISGLHIEAVQLHFASKQGKIYDEPIVGIYHFFGNNLFMPLWVLSTVVNKDVLCIMETYMYMYIHENIELTLEATYILLIILQVIMFC